MKSIVLVTLFDDNNIGNRLQHYALQTILESKGAVVTNLDNRTPPSVSFRTKIKRCIKHILSAIGIRRYRAEVERRHFYKIRKKTLAAFNNAYIHHVVHVSHANVYQTDWSRYDLGISGSDQVFHKWSADPLELPYYYLMFLPQEKRTSYAASFGFEEFPPSDLQQHIEGLNGMQHLSFRERSGCDLVQKSIGKQSAHVLDPTLLLQADDWRKLADHASNVVKRQSDYVFVYFLGDITPEYASVIQKKSNGKKIINFQKYSDNQTASYGPSEFLYLIDHADFVLTDSFHCTVFSVLFQKNFLAFRRQQPGFEHMFGRIENWLASTDSLHRIYGGTHMQPTRDFAELYGKSLQYIDDLLKE